jgi:hypothetical protein
MQKAIKYYTCKFYSTVFKKLRIKMSVPLYFRFGNMRGPEETKTSPATPNAGFLSLID